jgi:hypothetical protein
MPPEVLEKILAKLDQVDPISKEDLLNALLGKENSSLDISREIKKVISNIDALAELEMERTFQKVNEKLPGDLAKILSKLDQSLDSQSKKIIEDLVNKETSKTESTLPKEEIKPREVEPILPREEVRPTEIRPQEFEITLSKRSVNDLKKLFGGMLNDSFKNLEKVTVDENKKLKDGFSGISKSISDRGPMFDLFGLGTLGRMLKPIGMGILAAVTSLSLLMGAFGKDLTSVIDRIFGTNLSLITRVVEKLTPGIPSQAYDFLTKWSSRFFASRAFGETTISKAGENLKRVPALGGLLSSTMGPLWRGTMSALTGKNYVAPESKTGIKAMEGAAKLAEEQKVANAAQKAIYDKEKAALMRGQGFRQGLTEAQAIEKLAAEGISETAPTITKGAGKASGLVARILTKFGIGATERLLTKIPFGIGALFGLGFGAERIMRGDYVSGVLQIMSGIASIFPGAGTAISLALDVLDIGLAVAAPEFKKSANKFMWQNGLKYFPLFNFFRYLGYHIDSGRPWLAVFDLLRLVPGTASIANTFETFLTSDIEKQTDAGKPISFSKLGQMVRKNLWKSISPYIPEMWGLKKWFAEATGLSDETISEGEPSTLTKPEGSPYKPFPTPSKNTYQKSPKDEVSWSELHKGEHFISEGRGKGKWVKDLQYSLQEGPKGFSADEEFNKVKLPSALEDSSDMKNYMTTLNTTLFNLTNSFKDFSQNYKGSEESPSIVSINSSTQNNGGGLNYLMGGRDPTFEYRTLVGIALNRGD